MSSSICLVRPAARTLSRSLLASTHRCRAGWRHSLPPTAAARRTFIKTAAPDQTSPAVSKRGGSKVYASADEAVADVQSGSTILSSGFGLCGVAGGCLSLSTSQSTRNMDMELTSCRNPHPGPAAPRPRLAPLAHGRVQQCRCRGQGWPRAADQGGPGGPADPLIPGKQQGAPEGVSEREIGRRAVSTGHAGGAHPRRGGGYPRVLHAYGCS